MKKAGMGWRLAVFVLVWMLMLGWLSASVVKAEGDPGCSVDQGGGKCDTNSSGCTGKCDANSGGGASYQCDPGKTYEIITNKTYVGNGCLVTVGYGNQCDGIYHYESYIDTSDGSCSMSQTAYQKPVCEKMSWTTTGLQCDSTCFGVDLSARVAFPGFCIDVEPYPVTLVNYDTAIRNSCMGTASGSDTVNFAGKGTPSNPQPGDMRNITFTISLVPYDGNAYVWLPKIPPLKLPMASPNGSMPYIFRWQQASHPDAGANEYASRYF